MKHKKKYILDYRVVLKPDKRLGSNKPCFVAYCPTLGVADDGDTTQEALDNIRGTIAFHLKCLEKEGKEIPVDRPDEELVTNARLQFSFSPSTRFAT
jgi:predicted RNase H-like HicB family nuclease